MKTSLLLLLLAGLVYYYFQNNPVPRQAHAASPVVETRTANGTLVAAEEKSQPVYQTNNVERIVIAALPSYSERWKTGENAQTNLKTGPNAQTEFAPFDPVVTPTPSNQPSGYTSVSGVSLRR